MTTRPLVLALALLAGPAALAAPATPERGPQLVSVLEVRSKLSGADRASFDTGFFTDRVRGELLDSGAMERTDRRSLERATAARR